jgi:hypothetical protein
MIRHQLHMGECNQLLVVLIVQLLCQPRQPLDGTVEEIDVLLNRLRVHYTDTGAPYGDDDRGFRRWLLDLWPAPPMA